MENNNPNDLEVLTEVIGALKKLSREDQKRALQAVATFLNIPIHGNLVPNENQLSLTTNPSPSLGKPTFSEDRSISAKDFMRQKAPKTDVERVICLAYYLAQYRDIPHFKTLDISALNTEAAQPKFSSASVAVENAARAGFFVQAVKGNKQISALGELYVQHLPDRDAAKSGIQEIRPKRRPRKPVVKKPVVRQQ